MHRVEGEDAVCDESRSQQGFEGADFVLLFLHVDLEQHHSCGDIIRTQLMHWLAFFAGRPHRFAINGDVGMLQAR